jgi:hypothetical protein
VPDEPRADPPDEETQFRGTLFVVMVIIMLTAGMWAAMYFMLLGR